MSEILEAQPAKPTFIFTKEGANSLQSSLPRLLDVYGAEYHSAIVTAFLPLVPAFAKEDPDRFYQTVGKLAEKINDDATFDLVIAATLPIFAQMVSTIEGEYDFACLVEALLQRNNTVQNHTVTQAALPFVHIVREGECAVDTVAKAFFKVAEKLPDAAPVKRGVFTPDFAVSVASPGSKRHTIVVPDDEDPQKALVLSGCFHGGIEKFTAAVLETHPWHIKSRRPSHRHYQHVIAMAKTFEERLTP